VHRRAFLAGTVAVATGGCIGLASSDDYDVGMTSQAFDPEDLTVEVGTEVIWKNTSSRAHTVTAYESGLPDGAAFFASGGYESTEAAREAWRANSGGGLYGSEMFRHTFETSGTHAYFCIPHERGGMVGTVEVVE